MTVADARAQLIAAMRAALPSFVTIPDHPIASGKYSRIAAVFTIDAVVPALDNGTDVYEAELRIDVPATPSTPNAWAMVDDLVQLVDDAMPIEWLVLDDWGVTTETFEAVTLLRATCMAIGHPQAEPAMAVPAQELVDHDHTEP